jgi:hypothetical protein
VIKYLRIDIWSTYFFAMETLNKTIRHNNTLSYWIGKWFSSLTHLIATWLLNTEFEIWNLISRKHTVHAPILVYTARSNLYYDVTKEARTQMCPHLRSNSYYDVWILKSPRRQGPKCVPISDRIFLHYD